MTTLTAPCGKTKSNTGKPFTPQSLAQHERSCRDCNKADDTIKELGLEMTDLVAGDEESDGVYWAMAWELGEW
jgi:hypothetical protein